MMTYMLSPLIRSFVAYAHVLVFAVLLCSIGNLDFELEKSGVVLALPVDSLSQYNVSRFPFLDDYPMYQISDGVGGNADEEALEVFVRPFDGVDLATLPYSIYDALLLAKEESEDAEIEIFEPAIEKEGGNLTWKGRALQVGLVKNRVLYATASVQAQKIKAAQNIAKGVIDPYADHDWEYKESYLQWAIDADRANRGQTSLCAAGDGIHL